MRNSRSKWSGGKGWRCGGGCCAASLSQMSLLAWNCRGLGSSLAVWTLTDEVRAKDPLLVFLLETKARKNRIKGIQNKLEYSQGLSVQSDGRSGGLALLWREGTDVRFKSCSNLHIDVEIHDGSALTPTPQKGIFCGN